MPLGGYRDGPGIVFPGNVFPGKWPSGKVIIRETTVSRFCLAYAWQNHVFLAMKFYMLGSTRDVILHTDFGEGVMGFGEFWASSLTCVVTITTHRTSVWLHAAGTGWISLHLNSEWSERRFSDGLDIFFVYYVFLPHMLTCLHSHISNVYAQNKQELMKWVHKHRLIVCRQFTVSTRSAVWLNSHASNCSAGIVFLNR